MFRRLYIVYSDNIKSNVRKRGYPDRDHMTAGYTRLYLQLLHITNEAVNCIPLHGENNTIQLKYRKM